MMPSNFEDVLRESQIEAGRTRADDMGEVIESEVGAEPPIESTDLPEMDALVTAADIRAAYRELYATTANAMDAALLLGQARVALKDAEVRVWPGDNETERKAAMRAGTAIAREREQLAAKYASETEAAQALAKIRVDELRMLLRLAEWEQRADELILSSSFAEND